VWGVTAGLKENDWGSHDRNGQYFHGEIRVAFCTEALTGGAGLSTGRGRHSGRAKPGGPALGRREGACPNFNGLGARLRMCRDVVVRTKITK